VDRLERADDLTERTFSRTDDAGANQHVSFARLRAHFAASPLDRYWPVWLALFLLASAAAGWAAWTFNPFLFLLALNFVLAFGLLSWNQQTGRALAVLGGRRIRATAAGTRAGAGPRRRRVRGTSHGR
jgi:hypothetical protein